MKTQKDPMGDRFKRYEAATQQLLPRRTYTILRVDGKAFHTTLRHAAKPFDESVAWAMDETARKLCEEVQGTVFAYTQSDEISLLLQDFSTIDTGAWFDGNLQKMTSISAAIAAVEFTTITGYKAYFDSRVFTISDPVEVANYFIWRQRDAVRNSILATAQAHFGPKRIQGINTRDLENMLADENVYWTEMPGRFTHGALVQRELYVVKAPNGPFDSSTALRSRWVARPVEDAWTVNYLRPLIPTLEGGHDTEGEDRQRSTSPPEPAIQAESSEATQNRSN